MLQHYLHIAGRQLRAQRGYTALYIVGLTIGMAGGLLIFLFLQHHLSTDRHHTRFDRIYRITTDLYLDNGAVEYYPEAPLPMAQVLRTAYPQVEEATFVRVNRSLTVNLNAPNGGALARFLEQDNTALVEGALFQILDYHWLSGDPNTALRAPGSVVLTESWSQRYFGTADPLGQVLELDHRVKATVTGVVADPTNPTDTHIGLFISMPTIRQLDPTYDVTEWWQLNSTNRLYFTLKPTAPPTAIGQLEASLAALSKTHFGKTAQLHTQPLADVHFDTRRSGGVIRRSLLGAVGLIGLFLVLTACINFINLATAQAFRRSKEVGVRKTMGSSRAQLAGQFLLETSLIVGMALVLALLLTTAVLPLFRDWVHAPLALRPTLPTLLFVGLLPVGVVLLAGGYPAFVLARFSARASLSGNVPASAVGGYSLRQWLIVLQFVICQALLVGALVVVKQVRFTQQTDLGYRRDNVLIVSLPSDSKKALTTLKNELSQYPAIRSVTLQYRPPSAVEMNGGSFKFGANPDWVNFPVRERLADADYLTTYNLQLLAGRNIVASDSIREYVINETLLHKLGYQKPEAILGQRMQYHLSAVPLPIVGVVKDFHLKSLHDPIEPCFVASYPAMYRQVGIRLAGPSSAQTLAHVRAVFGRLYPADVFTYSFLDDQLARFYETETTLARLVNLFAGLILVICGLGLYGLVTLTVTRRTKEIGVRKVLGASVGSIVALLSTDVLRLVLVAIVIASPLAWWAMQAWLAGFAYRIDLHWWMIAGAGTLAVGIALLTISYQTIRAALMNPVASLRSE